MNYPRFLRTVGTSLPKILPLMRDQRVPAWLKAGAAGLALLIISPLDPFGDIPGLGLLDDAVLLALLTNGFVAMALRYTLRTVAAEAPMKRAGSFVQRLQP